jgi:hypothetical protein
MASSTAPGGIRRHSRVFRSDDGGRLHRLDYERLAVEVLLNARRELRPAEFAQWLASDMGQLWLAWLPGVNAEALRDRAARSARRHALNAAGRVRHTSHLRTAR